MGAVESGGVITLTGANTLDSINTDINDNSKWSKSGSTHTTGTTITEIQYDTGSSLVISTGEILEVANTVEGFIMDMNGTSTITMNGSAKISVPSGSQGTTGWHFNLAGTASVDINDTAITEYMGFGVGNSSAFITGFLWSGTIDYANGTTIQHVVTGGNSAFWTSSGNSSPYTVNFECNFDDIDLSASGASFSVFHAPALSGIADSIVTFKDCVMTNMTGFVSLQLGRSVILGTDLTSRYINIIGLPGVPPATTVQNIVEFHNTAYTGGPAELGTSSIIRDFVHFTLTVDDGAAAIASADVKVESEDGVTTYYSTTGYSGSDAQTDGSGQVVLNTLTTAPQVWEHIDGSTPTYRGVKISIKKAGFAERTQLFADLSAVNATQTLSLTASAVPSISAQTLSDFSITTEEVTNASCTVANMTSSDEVWVEVLDGSTLRVVQRMITTDDSAFTSVLFGSTIKVGTGMTVKFYAINPSGADEATAGSTLTVIVPPTPPVFIVAITLSTDSDKTITLTEGK